MNPVTCAQWYRPFRIERTAIIRRNSTRRRVQTFSSGSIRSDDIAAIDIALSLDLSRPWSRADASDMAADLVADLGAELGADLGAEPGGDLGIGAQRVLECSHPHVLARRGGKINCR